MKRTCTIFYTSDVHGYIFPTDYIDDEPKPMGLLAAAPLFSKDGNTIIIDGGDSLQGSPFLHLLREDRQNRFPMVGVMNSIGYDYITLGNHDFNYGYDGIREYLLSLDARCLCANVLDANGELPLLPYAIHTTESGIKVGIVGITTDYTPHWEPKENLEGFVFLDAFRSIQERAAYLKDRVDVLIGIYHGGYECDTSSGALISKTNEDIACKICSELDLDILLTAHQHRHQEGTFIGGTFTAQTLSGAREVLRLDIEVGALDQLTIKHSSLYPEPVIDTATPAYGPLRPLEDRVRRLLNTAVVPLHTPISFAPRLQQAIAGSAIATFINLAQQHSSGANLSATCLYEVPPRWEGGVRIRDILALYPFPNTLKVLTITGADLISSLERSAAYLEVDEGGQVMFSPSFVAHERDHYDYDFFWGIDYRYDVTRAVGKRVVHLHYQGRPVRRNDSFTIALNSYRASGGGGYPWYKSAPIALDSLSEIPALLVSCLQEHGFVAHHPDTPIFTVG